MDETTLMLDSTTVKVHQHASGEVVHKGNDDAPKKQKSLASVGVGHIAELVRYVCPPFCL